MHNKQLSSSAKTVTTTLLLFLAVVHHVDRFQLDTVFPFKPR